MKYNETDFMPPHERPDDPNDDASATNNASEENVSEKMASDSDDLDSLVSVTDTERVARTDPEIEKLPENHTGGQWSRYVLHIFSPLLITTYAIVLALWLTPLSMLEENTRLSVSFVVLLTTAMIPMAYNLTLTRLYYQGKRRYIPNLSLMACIMAVCQGITAYYLYRIHAPEWLVMIAVTGCATSLLYAVLRLLMPINAHVYGMASLTGILFYMGRNGLLDVLPTPWIVGFILLTGLVGSAAMQRDKTSFAALFTAFLFGSIFSYVIMSVHFFNSLV